MNEEKIFYLLHLARKAGKLRMGFDVSKNACYSGNAKLLLLAKDLAKKTEIKCLDFANSCNVKVLNISSKKKFSESFNVRELGIICIEDKNFSDGISNLV